MFERTFESSYHELTPHGKFLMPDSLNRTLVRAAKESRKHA